jgi:hypothetical protein
MGNIDRADWHYGGGDLYPKELPPENGGTHIGMYLAWIIQRGLGSAMLQKYPRLPAAAPRTEDHRPATAILRAG